MLSILIGGFFGTLGRYSLSTFINNRWPFIFPLATFFINSIGCFFIGIIAGLHVSEQLQSLLIIGLLGGFTTFSTFSVENAQLILYKKPFLSLFYIVASVIVGLISTWIGYVLVV